MTYETILFEIRDGIARLTLNRPDAANGLTPVMCREIYDAATVCDHDPGVRAVLLTGAGAMFCAGGDIRAFQEAGGDVGALVSNMTLPLHGAVSVFSRMDAPVVVAVNPGSMLGSKMVRDAFGVAGADIGIGARILVRAALDDEFAAASGQYFDNDSGRFAAPHPDALDPRKTGEIVREIEAVLAGT